MKDFAIVIGHTLDSKGACSPHGIPCEWDFNKGVAQHLTDIADVYNHKTYAKGYTSMVKETANELNKHNYKVVIFLHYNSAGETATGCEVLYYAKSVKGAQYAKEACAILCKDFNQRSRGAKGLSNNDRGFGEVYYPKAVALLFEPFFGSNISDVNKFKNKEKEYSNSIRKFLLSVK